MLSFREMELITKMANVFDGIEQTLPRKEK